MWDQIMITYPAAERRANAETPRQGVALRGPAAASDYYKLLPHGTDHCSASARFQALLVARVSPCGHVSADETMGLRNVQDS